MEIIVRATVVFIFLLLLTRGLRKRTLADMAPFEMLLLVVLGDIVQQGVTQEDQSLTGAILAVTTVAFWASVLSYASWRWPAARGAIEGRPLVILRDGELDIDALLAEQIPVTEVYEAARLEGIGDLDDVALAVLEPNGRVSFIPHRARDAGDDGGMEGSDDG